MRESKFLRGLKVLVVVVIAVTVLSLVTMHLWNWLMPALFGLRRITWAQALGLLLLSRILFGGFGGRGRGRGGRRGWKGDLKERWKHMTPEDRERLRAGMRGRWGCGFGTGRETTAEQKPVGPEYR
jgi:hypothetical protein